MAITKEMLKRCSNELKQAFCALPEDVQKAICADRENAQLMEFYPKQGVCFKRANLTDPRKFQDRIWRMSPDTPTEPEWEEREVVTNTSDYLRVVRGCFTASDDKVSVTLAQMHKDFLGIIYLKDGIETLRTSVDAAFGVPVRVRFSK